MGSCTEYADKTEAIARLTKKIAKSRFLLRKYKSTVDPTLRGMLEKLRQSARNAEVLTETAIAEMRGGTR